MKISARNQLKGVISNVEKGAVSAVVSIKLANSTVKATISNSAVEDLDLAVGLEAYAIIKATSVVIGTEVGRISARNVLPGTIEAVEVGAVNDIVALKSDDGPIIKATISKDAVDELGLKAGDKAFAVIKATDVMVGVDHPGSFTE